MPCPYSSKKCGGPYKRFVCEKCALDEGVCLNEERTATIVKKPFPMAPGGFIERKVWSDPERKQVIGCSGPLVVSGRCPFCTKRRNEVAFKECIGSWEALKNLRSWQKFLTTQKPNLSENTSIIEAKSCRFTPAQIEDFYIRNFVSEKWCPWMKVGAGLYATVAEGNDEAWTVLLERLHQAGERKFAILTGRHGIEHGTIVNGDDGTFHAKIPDKSHTTDDVKRVVSIRAKLNALDLKNQSIIRVLDVGTTKNTTMTRTRGLIMELLSQGYVVVLAWCYSYLSFYEVNVNYAKKKMYDMDLPYNKKISIIYSEKWDWSSISYLKKWVIVGARSVPGRMDKSDSLMGFREWRCEVAKTPQRPPYQAPVKEAVL